MSPSHYSGNSVGGGVGAEAPAGAPTRSKEVGTTSLLRKVKAKAHLRAHRKVRSVLDGEHGSIHKGRSMDFDDLREYVIGDDVKDLDWKATARSGRPLVKRFVATRQHAVMLVVDTGRSMSALADATSTKRDVAVFAAGVVAQLATRHGDLVGLLAAPAPPGTPAVRNAARAQYIAPGAREVHIERILRTIHDAIDPAGLPSQLDELLDYAAQNLHRQMILVVIADDTDLTDRHRALLRRLDAQHEVLYCTVGDVAMTDPALLGRDLHVVGVGAHVPAYFRRSEALHDDLIATMRRRANETRATLGRLGIAATRISSESSVVPGMVELLERHRRTRH
jgi:uncharacterized protein (DUF58 family)